MTLENRFIRSDVIVEKQYQTKILNELKPAINSLVIMPTGSGKTIVLARFIARLLTEGYKRILCVAPKVILVHQHFTTFTRIFKNVKICLLEAHSPQRLAFLQQNQIIVISTPHLIANERNKIKQFFEYIFFDEVHNVHTSYPYAALLNGTATTVGLSASISNKQKFKQLVNILDIKAVHNLSSTDYSVDIEEQVIHITLGSQLTQIVQILKSILFKYRTYIGLKPTTLCTHTYVERLKTNSAIRYAIGIKLIRLQHLHLLLSTQPPQLAKVYLAKTPPTKCLLKTELVTHYNVFESIRNLDVEHQKMQKIKEILQTYSYTRCIIFTRYRLTAEYIIECLGLSNAVLLLGQSANNTRKNQVAQIQRLKQDCNILVSTAVGYEGLDIPSADLIIIHEPARSVTQYIQQRGRTARAGATGKVIYLINRNTVDETYYSYLE